MPLGTVSCSAFRSASATSLAGGRIRVPDLEGRRARHDCVVSRHAQAGMAKGERCVQLQFAAGRVDVHTVESKAAGAAAERDRGCALHQDHRIRSGGLRDALPGC